MSPIHSTSLLATATPLLAVAGPWAGKLAFVAVFVALLVWLILMPARLIGQADGTPRWWRNARVWAIVVTVIQIAAYAWWG